MESSFSFLTTALIGMIFAFAINLYLKGIMGGPPKMGQTRPTNHKAHKTLILAGSDTTLVSLTWALSLLFNHPEVLKKAQRELDAEIGREKPVKESDLKNFVYVQAILKETLRLYPAGPLSLPHESSEDYTMDGYHVPKGSRLFFNLWKIHRDSRVWSDPLEFRPERFLTTHKDFDVRGQNFELIPFGSGRRMCPGINLALQLMSLSLAALLHGFDITTSADETVDMTEAIGMTNLKATPLKVLASCDSTPS